MNKSVILKALVFVPVLCMSMAFAQQKKGGAAPPPPPPPPPSVSSNAIVAYVFGGEEMRGENAEILAEAVVNNLTADKRYSAPRRGARGFFQQVAAEETRLGRRGRLLDDPDFCRIARAYDVSFLTVIDIEKSGRTNSVWARILDLNNCSVIATAEFTGLVRNNAEVTAAANALSRDLLNRRVGRRSTGR